jgi:hypothetical protein
MRYMTDLGGNPHRKPVNPAILPADVQQAVWFLGSLVKIRAGGDATGKTLAILEHAAERGYGSPLHRHQADEETFFVFEGDLRVEVGGEASTAGPGCGGVPAPPTAACVRRDQPTGSLPDVPHAGRVRCVHPGCRHARRVGKPARQRDAARSGRISQARSTIRHRNPRTPTDALI